MPAMRASGTSQREALAMSIMVAASLPLMVPSSRRFLFGDELERDSVHAIAQARGLGPVVEHVAQMPAAAAAMHLRARHEQAFVVGGGDGVLQRRIEAGPAGAAVELGGGGEERQVAAGAS